jgi:hypothetical protein
VTGKIDGLTADSERGVLIATVNEDVHSAFDLIYPAVGAVATYSYYPGPAVAGNGGTDSIAVRNGHIYVSHSNPNDVSQPTEYEVTLDKWSLLRQQHGDRRGYGRDRATGALRPRHKLRHALCELTLPRRSSHNRPGGWRDCVCLPSDSQSTALDA